MKNLTVNMPLAVPHQRPPSKYASHPYPVLVNEDAYSVSVKILDITLTQILKEHYIEDSYMPSVRLLDVLMESQLKRKDINGDATIVSVKLLNVTKRELLTKLNVNGDGTTRIVKLLDIKKQKLLIEHNINDADAVFRSVALRDITKKIK